VSRTNVSGGSARSAALPSLAATAPAPPRRARDLLARWLQPVRVFIILSALLGIPIIAATPPLRGPDESAHFLRALGVSQGDLIPSQLDVLNRKGIFLPEHLRDGFAFFEAVRLKEKGPDFHYGTVFAEYWRPKSAPTAEHSPAASDLVPYDGSEGYSPIAYLPHAVAALVARLAGLDFLGTFYLMRLAGLAAMTAVLAYAVAIVPQLKWAFVAIAMLPAALYGRAVISADGSAVATAILLAALCLRGLQDARSARPGELSFWMTACALSKPPNLAFVLLALMWRPLPELFRRWRLPLMIMLPAMIGAALWTFLSSGDGGTWRLIELTGKHPDEFDPALKFVRLLEHPMDFLNAALGTLQNKHLGELARQLIGVLGTFDTVLQYWVYPVVSILVLGTVVTRLQLQSRLRYQAAAAAAVTGLAYIVAVLLIMYLVWTPLGADAIWGVQGRYFVPILPLVAIVIAALVNRGFDERLTATMAISAALLSGGACVEAILGADWKLF